MERLRHVTDPGSHLAGLAADRSFRRAFTAIPDVGGRYSALTHFGLVPAALAGVDIASLLQLAEAMAGTSNRGSDLIDAPAAVLGAVLGEAARAVSAATS